MKKYPLLTTTLLTGALFCNGCWVTLEQGMQYQQDINTIREQNNSIKRQHEIDVARVTEKVNELINKTSEIEEKLENLDRSAHRGNADIGIEVTTLRQDLATLRGEIEITNHNLSEMGIKVTQIEEKQALPPPPPPPPVIENKEDKEDKTVVTAKDDKKDNKAATSKENKENKDTAKDKKEENKKLTEEELLAEAKKQLTSGNNSKAVTLYLQIAKKYPGKMGVTDRAIFGAATAYARQGKHQAAISEFGKIYQNFPKSTYVDDAMLGIAKSFKDLNSKEDAKAFLNELIKKYPKSECIPEAKKLLKSLK